MPAVAEVQFKAVGSQQVVNAFNSVGTAVGQAGTKIQQFTAGATTKIQQFTSSLNSIKSQGDPFSNLTTNLNSFNKSVDQSSQKATTFGQKLKNFGSQFGSSIASIGTLGGTILNLSRQYQDLGDTQIAVDRAQLKVSKTTEAVGVAQGKLNALTAKGVTTGAEYEQAQLDVKQALEAQSLAQQTLTERQEDHQRAQENFWIGLVPTVTSAGASVISVLNDIGGTKGFSGLINKMSGVGEAVKGLGLTMKGALIGTGIGAAIVALGLALEAFANNWWGVRDAVNDMGVALGNALPGLQPVLTALGKIGEGIVSTFGQGGTVTTALAESTLAIREFGDTSSASLDKALKILDFQKRLAEATKHMDDILMASRNDKERAAAIKAVEDLTKEGEKLLATETQQQALARNGIKLYADSTGVKMKDAGATNSLSTATDGLGQSTSALGPAIRGLGTDASNTWAELAKSTIPEVITWTSDWNAMTKLLTPTLTTAKTSTKGVNTELKALITNASRAAQLNQQLSQVLNKVSQSANKASQSINKYNTSLNPHYKVGKSGPAQGLGQGPGIDVGHYVTFSGGKKIGGGPGVAPPITKVSQHGYQGTVKRPTTFIAGEGGRPEDVTVRPRGSVQRGGSGGGGGGFYGIINVYVDGVLRQARYSMGARK